MKRLLSSITFFYSLIVKFFSWGFSPPDDDIQVHYTITQNPIIGSSHGQAGGMVFSRLFGQHIIRSRPATYADRHSVTQLVRRAIMKNLVKSLATIKSRMQEEFEHAPTHMAPFSRVLQQFLAGYPKNTAQQAPVVANIVVGGGSWLGFPFTVLCDLSDNKSTITWVAANCDPNIDVAATVDIMQVNLTTNTANFTETAATKASQTAFGPLPFGTLLGHKIIVLGCCKMKAGTELTKSVKFAVLGTVVA